jgi:hypothetical protein
VKGSTIPSTTAPMPAPAARTGPPRLLLVWTQEALPAGFLRRVRHLSGIARVVPVMSGVGWMVSSSAGGSFLDRPPAGFAIPLDVAGADPSTYAAVTGFLSTAQVQALDEGRALLGRTSAAIRRMGRGGAIRLTTGTVRVAGVSSDAAVGAHEVFLSARRAVALGIGTERYLIVRLDEGAVGSRVAARILHAAPPGTPLRIRSNTKTPYLRHADGVLPPVWEKVFFGEFAAHPVSSGPLDVDPSWVGDHIVAARVPILGVVLCNRAVITPLRGALRTLVRAGLASLVHPMQYRGCFVPSLIPGSGDISHHAWGSAFDINVEANWVGQPPHQDPRLVADFARWGFAWGGRFLVPDGMHFEYDCPGSFAIPETIRVLSPPPDPPLCQP